MADKPFQYIQTLLEAGSFSRAAKRLNISQPSLSQFIMRLEKDVGATLVDRVAKPLRLTPAGESLSVKITFATLSVLHGVVKHTIFA